MALISLRQWLDYAAEHNYGLPAFNINNMEQSRPPSGAMLAIDRIKAIHQRIPTTHLVMHGSSSVSQESLAMIRQYGGKIKETYGVPISEIVEGVKHGVRLAMTAALRKKMAESPEEFDPRVLFTVAIIEAQKVCKDRFEVFGSAGRAN